MLVQDTFGGQARSMSALTKLDVVLQRSRSTAIAVATAKKFSEDQATNLATMIAFWAFFSIFPLLLGS